MSLNVPIMPIDKINNILIIKSVIRHRLLINILDKGGLDLIDMR